MNYIQEQSLIALVTLIILNFEYIVSTTLITETDQSTVFKNCLARLENARQNYTAATETEAWLYNRFQWQN